MRYRHPSGIEVIQTGPMSFVGKPGEVAITCERDDETSTLMCSFSCEGKDIFISGLSIDTAAESIAYQMLMARSEKHDREREEARELCKRLDTLSLDQLDDLYGKLSYDEDVVESIVCELFRRLREKE